MTLSVEGIDRMYLNVFVPGLQYESGIVRFFRHHRGMPLPSAALMQPMSRGFVSSLEAFAARNGIALVQFRKGERKDTVMAARNRFSSSSTGDYRARKAPSCAPASSPRMSPRPCTSTTRTPTSSSITSRTVPFAPRPPSTTPMTSASASACTICPSFARSALPPIAGSLPWNEQVTTA